MMRAAMGMTEDKDGVADVLRETGDVEWPTLRLGADRAQA